MSTLQTFLATAIAKATADLETALLRLPEEKRNWSAGGDARSALDMVAEIAILNGTVADTIQTRKGMTDFDYAAYTREKAALCEDWPALKKMLDDNTARVVEVIRVVPDDDLDIEVQMPWGAMMTLSQIISYPYWNACYHEGQINFIASMLGCLK
jgi:uncharacterized damage-inducible protein DinB